MKPTPVLHGFILLAFALTLAACNRSISATETVEPTAIVIEPTLFAVTGSPPANSVKALTAEATEQPTESDSGSTCTVLQDLNLRFGPGTAYRPPIQVLPQNSLLTPLGFSFLGFPGGTWAYVRDRATQTEGWVSAGSEYIDCDVDLTTLPEIVFDPPPPFFPTTVQTSPGPGQGFCKTGQETEYSCVLTFSDDFLFQVQVFRNGVEISENDGVQPISFTVTKDDQVVYQIVEGVKDYCIFGGNGPCNEWTFEGGVLKWGPGGAPVESGEYKMAIDVTVNDEYSHWESFFTLDVP